MIDNMRDRPSAEVSKIGQDVLAAAASQAYAPLSSARIDNLKLNTPEITNQPGSSLLWGGNRRLEGDLGEGGKWNKAKPGAE